VFAGRVVKRDKEADVEERFPSMRALFALKRGRAETERFIEADATEVVARPF
jgi:hypothetical protein